MTSDLPIVFTVSKVIKDMTGTSHLISPTQHSFRRG